MAGRIFRDHRHARQGVCGRFTTTQINMSVIATEELSIHVFNSSLSYCKKIAALILITFGIIVTNVSKSYSQTAKADTAQTILKPDTPSIDPMVVGEVEYTPSHPAHKPKPKAPVKKVTCPKQDHGHLLGKVIYTPPEVIMGTVQANNEKQ